MNVVTVKPGVEFKVIASGGFCILAAIQRTCTAVECDLVITSGTDGAHSGELDPHHSGNAYDIRTHDLPEQVKANVLSTLMTLLGWERFYAFIEAPDTDNEHLHVQVAKGVPYP